ncbi:MAG: glutamine-hydrolyzing carbamoyl-phosphate synthase small subunit [Anaeroplasmataceae bacterium]
MKHNKKLVLKDGRFFECISHASESDVIGELVFNTSMVGYQEIVTDPSYCGQMVVMTYPLIGNYGINEDDNESKRIALSGLIVKEYNDEPSNFRSTLTLGEVLTEAKIPLVSGIDTRMLTRIIRDEGSQLGLITNIDTPIKDCIKKLNEFKVLNNQVEQVSTKKKYTSISKNSKYNIVCVDFGTKLNIIRRLNEKNCNVAIVPHNTDLNTIMELEPDGLFLSNGPGNPEDNKSIIKIVKELKGKLPIFGICLGHQIIALAYGCKTYKLKFGHRGANHPVKNLETNKIEITSQNHSYAVDTNSILKSELKVTHINLLDDTVEGVMDYNNYLFSVQYHPESASGPEDSNYLFDNFISNIKRFKGDN